MSNQETIQTRIPTRLYRLPVVLVDEVGAPLLFGYLIGTGSRTMVCAGYLVSAALMVASALLEWLIGVDAEGKSQKTINAPLTSIRN